MHKKLIAALLLSSSFAVAAATVTVVDDATKDLTFTLGNTYVIDGVTNVKTATSAAGANLKIDFGDDGCLVANQNKNPSFKTGGGVDFSTTNFLFNVTLTLKAEDVAYLISHGEFERVLIDSSLGEGRNHNVNYGGIVNVQYATAVRVYVNFDSDETKAAWQEVGLSDKYSKLMLAGDDGKTVGLMPEEGTFGLALRSGHGDTCEAPSKLVFVANIADPVVPEPATATLSLLALAGLATRRKRK